MVLVDPPHDDPVATLSDELPGGDDDPVAFLNLDDPVRAVVVLRVGGFLRFLVAKEMMTWSGARYDLGFLQAPELVAAAGKEGEEEDLANKDALPTLDTTAPAEVVAVGGKDGERWNKLPSSGDILQDFLDDVVRVAVVLGFLWFLVAKWWNARSVLFLQTPKVVAAGGKDGDNEELPWLTNKDAFQGDSVPWASFPNDIPSDDEYLLALLHDDVVRRVAVVLRIRGFLPYCGSWLRNDETRGRFLQAPGGKDGDKEEQLSLTNKDAFPTLDTMAPAETGAAAAPSPTPSPPARRQTPVVVVDAIHRDPVTLDTMAPAEDRAKAARPRRKCVRPLGAAARSPTPPSPPRLEAPAKEKRECEHCGTDETPLWRKGPEGRPTLCNACGMRLKKGKLLPEYRPLKSPTFSPDLHSNLHRRVLDMARCREEEEAKASDADATSGDWRRNWKEKHNFPW
jgi:hypothetical protein